MTEPGPSSSIGSEAEIPRMAPFRAPRNRIAEREAELIAERDALQTRIDLARAWIWRTRERHEELWHLDQLLQGTRST